jgi:hypothetical protein
MGADYRVCRPHNPLFKPLFIRNNSMNELDSKRLKELFNYNPETGIFTRKIERGGKKAGTIAGKQRKDGYIDIKISPKRYLAHRLAWLYVYDNWPNQMLDHINGIRNDNKILNLREVNNSENQQNKIKARKDSKSGFQCVIYKPSHKKWQAYITVDGIQKHIGYFNSPEEAHSAYLLKKKELHPIANF